MEIVAHAVVVGVFVCLDLLLFFYLLPSCAALLDVFRVLVMIGGCLVS